MLQTPRYESVWFVIRRKESRLTSNPTLFGYNSQLGYSFPRPEFLHSLCHCDHAVAAAPVRNRQLKYAKSCCSARCCWQFLCFCISRGCLYCLHLHLRHTNSIGDNGRQLSESHRNADLAGIGLGLGLCLCLGLGHGSQSMANKPLIRGSRGISEAKLKQLQRFNCLDRAEPATVSAGCAK